MELSYLYLISNHLKEDYIAMQLLITTLTALYSEELKVDVTPNVVGRHGCIMFFSEENGAIALPHGIRLTSAEYGRLFF